MKEHVNDTHPTPKAIKALSVPPKANECTQGWHAQTRERLGVVLGSAALAICS